MSNTFSEHQRLAESQNGDILVIFGLLVVLRVLSLATDRVAHLAVLPGPVVVPGEHRNPLHGATNYNDNYF